jgi:hypothetical protein
MARARAAATRAKALHAREMPVNDTTVKLLLLCLAAFAVATPMRAAPVPTPQSAPLKEPVLHVYRTDALQGLTVKGDGDQEIGQLESFVIDASDGDIAYAVIAEGGMLGIGVRQRLVPWNVLHFSPKGGSKRAKDKARCEVVALLSGADVARCPEFERGTPITAEVERKAHEAARNPTLATLGQLQPARLVSSLDLVGCGVQGSARLPLGRIEQLLLDPVESRVACVVLYTKGAPGIVEKRIAIPWAAAEVALDAAKRLLLATQLTKERLDGAPSFVGKDWKRMTSPAWLREVASYFDVEPYWIRAVPPAATSAIR